VPFWIAIFSGASRPKFGFGLALGWLAVHEATTYAEHFVDIGRRTAIERVAHFLLEIHARLAAVGRAAATAFDLPLSQEIMSDALGLSVPHINRMLAEPARLTRIPAPARPSAALVPKRAHAVDRHVGGA